MSRPLLLDLFCGAGGAAMGYSRAGFDVVGVDVKPQPNYPFRFYQEDVMTLDLGWMSRHDAIHASPPCQRWLGVPFAKGDAAYSDLLAPTRRLIQRTRLPYVIENVPGAPLDGFILCGATFGLPVVRHRRFEMSYDIGLVPSACPQKSWGRATGHKDTFPFAHGSWRPRWRSHVMPTVWPWMTLEETHDAIPPAYTEFIGGQLIEHLERAA